MPVNVFVLGLPGSGKSTACRAIQDFLQQKGIEQINHLRDFDFLKRMAEEDWLENPPLLHRFKPTKHDGFNISPQAYDVLDQALQQINDRLRLGGAEEWVLVEFARSNYWTAFQYIDARFLQDAYFICLQVPKEICRKRLHRRIIKHETVDDYFVSDHILDTYYKRPIPLNIAHFRETYRLKPEQICIVSNNRELKYFVEKVHTFIDNALSLEKQRIFSEKTLP